MQLGLLPLLGERLNEPLESDQVPLVRPHLLGAPIGLQRPVQVSERAPVADRLVLDMAGARALRVNLALLGVGALRAQHGRVLEGQDLRLGGVAIGRRRAEVESGVALVLDVREDLEVVQLLLDGAVRGVLEGVHVADELPRRALLRLGEGAAHEEDDLRPALRIGVYENLLGPEVAHEGVHDREPEPDAVAPLRVPVRPARAEELAELPLDLRVDPGPVILDDDLEVVIGFGAGAHADLNAPGGRLHILDGVHDEVVEDDLESARVVHHARLVGAPEVEGAAVLGVARGEEFLEALGARAAAASPVDEERAPGAGVQGLEGREVAPGVLGVAPLRFSEGELQAVALGVAPPRVLAVQAQALRAFAEGAGFLEEEEGGVLAVRVRARKGRDVAADAEVFLEFGDARVVLRGLGGCLVVLEVVFRELARDAELDALPLRVVAEEGEGFANDLFEAEALRRELEFSLEALVVVHDAVDDDVEDLGVRLDDLEVFLEAEEFGRARGELVELRAAGLGELGDAVEGRFEFVGDGVEEFVLALVELLEGVVVDLFRDVGEDDEEGVAAAPVADFDAEVEVEFFRVAQDLAAAFVFDDGVLGALVFEADEAGVVLGGGDAVEVLVESLALL